MKKSALLIISTFILICSSFAGEGLRIMESRLMTSKILRQDVHFSVCLPKTYYDSPQSYPVVYLLHGLGDNETSWLEYGRISQYADQAVQNGEAVPMIFIMPEAFRTYYVNDYQGTFLYQDMFVKELVPYIDSLFKTIPDRQHRALMGYSMGGFGALTLHLKYPDIFGSTVPLSISIRTDEQYMNEDASEWDQQWGRLFGAPGLTGADRITTWYRENCPFYQLKNISAANKKKLNIYIDNGDKEQTLCRSNEELHILMHSLKIPHEYRVRDGGHSFGYWCSALPNALSFISDATASKPYRGDLAVKESIQMTRDDQMRSFTVQGEKVNAYVPADYDQTDRLYPVIYLVGQFSGDQRLSIGGLVDRKAAINEICPMLLVFLPDRLSGDLEYLIPEIEKSLRIREGYRFRTLLGYQEQASGAFLQAVKTRQFGSCILTDPFLTNDDADNIVNRLKGEEIKRTSIYIDTPDQGNHVAGNGLSHMLMRDADVTHEYRVREGGGGFSWMMRGLPDLIHFASNRFHK